MTHQHDFQMCYKKRSYKYISLSPISYTDYNLYNSTYTELLFSMAETFIPIMRRTKYIHIRVRIIITATYPGSRTFL